MYKYGYGDLEIEDPAVELPDLISDQEESSSGSTACPWLKKKPDPGTTTVQYRKLQTHPRGKN